MIQVTNNTILKMMRAQLARNPQSVLSPPSFPPSKWSEPLPLRPVPTGPQCRTPPLSSSVPPSWPPGLPSEPADMTTRDGWPEVCVYT